MADEPRIFIVGRIFEICPPLTEPKFNLPGTDGFERQIKAMLPRLLEDFQNRPPGRRRLRRIPVKRIVILLQ